MKKEENIFRVVVRLVLAFDFLLGVAGVHSFENAEPTEVCNVYLQLLNRLVACDVIHSGSSFVLQHQCHFPILILSFALS